MHIGTQKMSCIGPDGGEWLKKGLEMNTTVTRIELSGLCAVEDGRNGCAENSLGNEGAASIAEALRKNTSITIIGLCGGFDCPMSPFLVCGAADML